MVRTLFDCDDTIIDFEGMYLRRCNEKFPEKGQWTADKVTEWDLAKSIGLTRDEEMELLAEGFPHELEALPGAVEGVKRIAKISEVHFVTSHFSGLPHWAHARDKWLVDHFGDLGRRAHHTHHKYAIAGDIFVDDKPDHVALWSTHWPDGYACLWHRRANQDASIPGAIRTYSWDMLHEIVRIADWEERTGRRKHFQRIP